jgi:RNA-directed DNA polymerase
MPVQSVPHVRPAVPRVRPSSASVTPTSWPVSDADRWPFGKASTRKKAKIVFCKGANRRGEVEHTSFDFLGSPGEEKGRLLCVLLPGHQRQGEEGGRPAGQAWHLRRRTGSDLAGLAEAIKSSDTRLVRLLRSLLPLPLSILAKRVTSISSDGRCTSSSDYAAGPVRAWAWFSAVRQREPRLFAHGHLLAVSPRRPVGAV